MFSILMPIYNGINFIDESVGSIKDQTFKDWELIISINGHPQNGVVYNIAKKYESDKIKVYDMYNIRGKSSALNESLQYCNYDNVCLLDVDDLWLPKKLEMQVKYVDDYDVVGTNSQYFGNSNNFPDIPLGEIYPTYFRYVNPIINSSSCFKKQDAYWQSDYDCVEDYDMWLRLNSLGKKFYNVPEVLVRHRIHSSSFFNTNSKQKDLEKVLLKKYFN